MTEEEKIQAEFEAAEEARREIEAQGHVHDCLEAHCAQDPQGVALGDGKPGLASRKPALSVTTQAYLKKR